MSSVKDTSKAAFFSTERGDVEQKVYSAFAVGTIKTNFGGNTDFAVSTRREAAEYTGTQASTVSGVVNRLIKAGWLELNTTKIVDQITGRSVEHVQIVGGRRGV